jgi:hypothetical protein
MDRSALFNASGKRVPFTISLKRCASSEDVREIKLTKKKVSFADGIEAGTVECESSLQVRTCVIVDESSDDFDSFFDESAVFDVDRVIFLEEVDDIRGATLQRYGQTNKYIYRGSIKQWMVFLRKRALRTLPYQEQFKTTIVSEDQDIIDWVEQYAPFWTIKERL